MTEGANARCARHPDSAARFTGPRCGSFACVDCERRASLDAAPVCPACWPLSRQATQAPSGALQTAGLVVGVLSLFPCCPLAHAPLVLDQVALVQATRENRWKPILGMSITVVVTVLQVLFVAFYQVFSKPN
jgi:hypothetical protein